MPTATTTETSVSAISLKATQHSPSSALATLRSLYPRAARAFLQRDVSLTHSLLSSAFSLIQPPPSLVNLSDTLSSQRRKWDILRITFETTLYASPPPTQDLPPALRANLMLSSEPLMTSIHGRSLHLFTPNDSPQKATSAFLPAQILVTLVLASLKLDCPEVGRAMIEDWLAKHGQEVHLHDPTGYAKVLELYCLHVLPKLQDWDYAQDFLAYETQLHRDARQDMTASVHQLRAQATSASNAHASLPVISLPSSSSSSTPSRSSSPALSDSSASSSSTHTATPRSPRTGTNGRIHTLTPLTPSLSPTPKPRERDGSIPPHSDSSSSIASTATSRTVTPHNAERDTTKPGRPQRANGHVSGHAAHQPHSRSRSSTPASASLVRRMSSFGAPATDNVARSPPSTLALIRASFEGLLQTTSRSRVLLYVVLFVVVPIVSYVFRRRRRAGTAVGNGGAAVASGSTRSMAVDAVRRRLRGGDGQGSVFGTLWAEVIRAVLDTVRMAGRGLV